MSHLDTSYPPSLCHHVVDDDDDDGGDGDHHRQHQNPSLESIMNSSDPVLIPVIDLQCLNDDEDDVLKKLDEACSEWGIFRLVSHGVPITLLEELEELTKQLFLMSFQTKKASCEGSPISYFWGTPILTPSRTALSRGHRKINMVEAFNLPLSQLSEFHSQIPLLQSFRVAMIEYGKHVSRIAKSLFKAMAKKLDDEVMKIMEKASSQYVSEKTAHIRAYRYPRSPNNHENNNNNNNNNNGSNWGMEPHTDSSVISILNHLGQDSSLELLHNHQWLPLQSIPNTLVVNIGDMMQAISDNRYKSAFHRVRIMEEKERISVCYFVFPEEDFVIESSNYKPFTYSDFRAQVQHDVKTIGYKVGLSRFTL